MENNKIFYINNEIAIANAVEEDNFLRIEGYACHYNVTNLNRERVNAKSFDAFFELYNSKKLTPMLNWAHNQDNIIGGIDTLESKKDGLYMTARLNKDVKIVADMILPNVLAGDIKGLSTEGWANNIDYDEKDDTYYVHDFMLLGIAVVKTPADWAAEFSFANYYKNNHQTEPAKPRKSIVYMW